MIPPPPTAASSAAAATASAPLLAVRVVSYNVLSSHLASPDHFTACRPHDLDFTTRVPRVLAKLEAEMGGAPYGGGNEEGTTTAAGTTSRPRPTIFCLQEVSHSWSGHLHTFFANRRYHMITGLYGRQFNDYMGVALAYPVDAYETVSVDQVRLSDCREGGWPREQPVSEFVEEGPVKQLARRIGAVRKLAASTVRRGVRRGIRAIAGPVRTLLHLPPPPRDPIDHWSMSENRHNVLLTACLRERTRAGDKSDSSDSDSGGNGDGSGGDDSNAAGTAGKPTFCVSTYHMPCAFYAPMVMNVHLDLAARRCQSVAQSASGGGDGGRCPHVFAGDFNILPDSPHYRLLTTGQLPRSDPTYPTPKHGVGWTPTAQPMRSAYASLASNEGTEPDFTNYAKIRDDDPFVGTLDYILLSDEWVVDGVKALPRRDTAGGPFPTEAEPSDHLVIAADLSLSLGAAHAQQQQQQQQQPSRRRTVAGDNTANKRVAEETLLKKLREGGGGDEK